MKRRVPNVSLCPVHESFECAVDLVRNLHYFDPDSAIILYDGGDDPALLTPGFPWERYGALVHPNPGPAAWGRLHGFAFDCIRLALEQFDFETLTIVDSDQLHVRGGYSHWIGEYLRERPEVGVLSNHPARWTLADPEGQARTALEEIELWRPFLERFPNGLQRFPHWSFWPGTVITRAAAEDLDRTFRDDRQLAEITARSRIAALEEVLIPSLAALLGYEIGLNPCSYRHNRWWGEISPEEVSWAVAMPDVFWVHRVTRQYGNPGRKAVRERFHGYNPPAAAPRLAPETVRVELPTGTAGAIVESARDLEGWLSDAEAELLIEAVTMLPRPEGRETTIVEVGSYYGKSTTVLGLALKAVGRTGTVYAVDPFDAVVGAHDVGVHTLGECFEQFEANIARAALGDVVRPVRGRAHEVVWEGPVDLLFIDGLHDYPNAARDYHHFARWLAPGALVAFHDHTPYWAGVCWLVDELLGAGELQFVRQADTLVLLQVAPVE
jgi:hypothetical protein